MNKTKFTYVRFKANSMQKEKLEKFGEDFYIAFKVSLKF